MVSSSLLHESLINNNQSQQQHENQPWRRLKSCRVFVSFGIVVAAIFLVIVAVTHHRTNEVQRSEGSSRFTVATALSRPHNWHTARPPTTNTNHNAPISAQAVPFQAPPFSSSLPIFDAFRAAATAESFNLLNQRPFQEAPFQHIFENPSPNTDLDLVSLSNAIVEPNAGAVFGAVAYLIYSFLTRQVTRKQCQKHDECLQASLEDPDVGDMCCNFMLFKTCCYEDDSTPKGGLPVGRYAYAFANIPPQQQQQQPPPQPQFIRQREIADSLMD